TVVVGLVVVVVTAMVVDVATGSHKPALHTSPLALVLSHCSPPPASITPSPHADGDAVTFTRVPFPTSLPFKTVHPSTIRPVKVSRFNPAQSRHVAASTVAFLRALALARLSAAASQPGTVSDAGDVSTPRMSGSPANVEPLATQRSGGQSGGGAAATGTARMMR